ncbi:MAG: aminomethyl-transferring glycine dehydrogenase subunit GcvPB [Thermoprotei archaeon]|mgnify:CR=1 FL=1|nr:aminomethyl-transferring glycine dehydrogenase subunit GcvPB [TACK group archaeon]
MKYRQAKWEMGREENEPLVFQLGFSDPYSPSELAKELGIPEELARKDPPEVPRVPEVRLARHYLHLSQMNFGVDSGPVPLGSCTMKYTPKVLERVAKWQRIADLSYEQLKEDSALLGLLLELQRYLAELTGMDAFTLAPKAGSQGELTALLMIRKYFEERGETREEGGKLVGRNQVLIPLTAHGSNFASAAMAGFEVVRLPVKDGLLFGWEKAVSENVAAVMLTVPNTYGLYEPAMPDLVRAVHASGGLAYYDGANMNSLLGLYRPGDMGFDVVQLNLHKTFASPHGGGGPGAGPVGVKRALSDYLPVPRIEEKEDGSAFINEDAPHSVGRISEGVGNLAALLRAYCYVRLLGPEGLADVARYSVLSSNYAASFLDDRFYLPSPGMPRKHEFAFAAKGKKASDVAKYLLSYGYAPSVHFPPELEESLMIEFTETEGRREIEEYMAALLAAVGKSEEELSREPSGASVSRVDEVRAARKPIVTYSALLSSDLKDKVRSSEIAREPTSR